MCLLKKPSEDGSSSLYTNMYRIRRPPLFAEDGVQNCWGSVTASDQNIELIPTSAWCSVPVPSCGSRSFLGLESNAFTFCPGVQNQSGSSINGSCQGAL
jgi:hypothetical protein